MLKPVLTTALAILPKYGTHDGRTVGPGAFGVLSSSLSVWAGSVDEIEGERDESGVGMSAETNEFDEAVIEGAGVAVSISSSPSISFVLTQEVLRRAETTEVCEFVLDMAPERAGEENGTAEISSNERPRLSSPSCPLRIRSFFFGLRAPTVEADTVLNFFFGW